MRKFLYVAVIATCCSFYIQKNKKFIPPGTSQISETFFADETEVSNFSWQEYESWIKTTYGISSAEYKNVLPDTLVWLDNSNFNEAYVKHYYRHSAYKNHPVVGISYDQAVAFCKWRTDRVKEYYFLKYKKELNIIYRLPTREEWDLMSNKTSDIFLNNGKNKKGEELFNHARQTSENDSIKDDDVTAPVYSYWKNSFGLFNVFGNVSEMISEKGISKGGSWKSDFEECRPEKNIIYVKPEAWLGFRCVCIIKEAS